MFLALFLGRLEGFNQSALHIHEVPHRPQFAAEARNQSAHARLESGRQPDAVELLAPDDSIAVVGQPCPADTPVLAFDFLATKFHKNHAVLDGGAVFH